MTVLEVLTTVLIIWLIVSIPSALIIGRYLRTMSERYPRATEKGKE